MTQKRESEIRRTPQSKPTFAGLRRYNRRDIEFGVYVQDEAGWEIPLEGLNISPTGVFVATDLLFEEGDEHTLVLDLPGRGVYRIRARVVRVEALSDDELPGDESAVAGMGYEFVDTEERAWSEFCALVAGA